MKSKFISSILVIAVVLAMVLVPGVVPPKVALASHNVTISVQPATTNVNFSEAFSITVEVDNPSGMPIMAVCARLDFDNTYFNVTSITAGPTLTNVLWNQYDNANGTIAYDAGMPMGVNTTSTTILVCTINCLSKSVAGSSTVDFVYTAGPPPRKTIVVYGPTDYLESGNMSLMYSGTVIIRPNCTCGDICVSETGWWRDGGTFNASSTPIQSAVNNATSGETICVKDGNYHENVDVDISNITIQSENGNANCVVNAANAAANVFNVTADWVNIAGFTVENATGISSVGIYLNAASHCNISNSNATNNWYGIIIENSSTNNTITNNTASNNVIGIYLNYSSNNAFTNNTASYNDYDGISLYKSSNNTFTKNIASNNDHYGIFPDHSNNNTFTNNTAVMNWHGIFLFYSSDNDLTNNTASNNDYGIYLDHSSSNIIYNNYFNNTVNAWDNGANTWNTTNSTGPNIIGGPYIGGNYWSDYTGSDTNGDGFGETTYNITGDSNKDYLPLLVPSGATLEVHISFTGRGGAPNSRWIESFEVRFFQNGNETGWSPINATTNNTGVFTINVTPGTYGIGIKNWTSLSALMPNVVLNDNATTYVYFGEPREGDANDDDYIGSSDFSLLSFAYNTWPGKAKWNPNCDFDRTDYVGSSDFSLLSFNYNKWGDAYGYF